ncbi:MAG TPA: histidine kinase, partial [Fibrella sp.]
MGRTVRDTWLRLVGITLLAAMVLATDDTYQQPISGQVLAKLLFSLSSIILIWHLNRFIILYVRAKLASGNQRIERLVITFVGCVLATTVLNWLVGAVQYWAIQGTLAGYVTQAKGISVTLNQVHFKLSYLGFDWLNGIINALFYVVLYSIVLFIQDTSQYRERLEQAEREKEQLRVANLQSQLDVLKQQVNPHFLFNALNSL